MTDFIPKGVAECDDVHCWLPFKGKLPVVTRWTNATEDAAMRH